MSRPVHHHAYLRRDFDLLADDLEFRGLSHIEHATHIAARFAADLAGYLERQLGFFDPDERIDVELGRIDRQPEEVVLPLQWKADGAKRLLPNVEATLHLVPLITSGPAATSEVTLQGSYSPQRVRHSGLIEFAVARRVVDATLHTFLRHLVEDLENGGPVD